MKKIALLAVLTVLIACGHNQGKRVENHGLLKSAWVFPVKGDIHTLMYAPGHIVVTWYFSGEFPSGNLPGLGDLTGEKNLVDSILNKDSDNAGYRSYEVSRDGKDFRVEFASNEKEMIIKLAPPDLPGKPGSVIFRISFLPGYGEGFNQEHDIIEAEYSGEKLFFHHYGDLVGRNYTDSLSMSVALDLSAPVYFYSGDERSAIYLDELIARKKREEADR